MRGLGRRAVALGLALVLAAGCSGGGDDGDDASIEPGTSESDAPAAEGGRLVVGLSSAPTSIDPTAGALSVTDLTYALAVFDPLMAVDADGEVVPYLAQSLESSDDGLRWTLVLRDVTFSDGQPVTADAVVRVLEAHLASELDRVALRGVESVSVFDRRTVEIRLTRPWATFPSVLTGQLGLVPAPSFLDGGPPVGSGPFVVEELVPGSSLRLRRSATYWRADEGLPHLDELELRAIADPADRVAALTAGSVDLLTAIEPDGVAALAEADDIGTALEDEGRIPAYTMVFNTAIPPFDELECRRAVAAAIDRDALVDAVAPDALVDDGDEVTRPDSASCDFTYRTGSSALDTDVSGAVRDMLDDAGITMTLRQSDTSDALFGALLGDFQAFASSEVDVADPDARDALLRVGNAAPAGTLGRNLGRFDDPDVEEALDAARLATDAATRTERDGAVDELVAELVPYLTLFRLPWAYGFDPDVGGIRRGLTLPDGGRAGPRPGLLLVADLHLIDSG